MAAPESIASLQEKLTGERMKLLASFANLTADTITRSLGDAGWSIKDVLAHVAMAEEVNIKFAKLMVAKNAPVQLSEFAAEYPDYPPPFELDKFNAWMAERWHAKSFEEIVAALKAARVDTLAWLATLSPEQLERAGEHAVWGNQSVRGMFRILVIHDKFHRGDIEKRKA